MAVSESDLVREPVRNEVDRLLAELGVGTDVRTRMTLLAALSTRPHWDDDELIDVMTAVLAKSEDEQKALAHRLAVLFATRRAAEEVEAAADGGQPAPVGTVKVTREVPESDSRPKQRRSRGALRLVRRMISGWRLAVAVAATAVGGVLVWILLHRLPPAACLGSEPARCINIKPPDDASSSGISISAALALVLVLVVVFVAIVIVDLAVGRRRERREEERRRAEQRRAIPPGPTAMPLGLIGGTDVVFFNRQTALAVALQVPRRVGNRRSIRLHERRSVAASVRIGVPSLEFRQLNEPCPVVVLSDRAGHDRAWCDLGPALALALENAGVVVGRATYAGRLLPIEREGLVLRSVSPLLADDAIVIVVGGGARFGSGDIEVLADLATPRRLVFVDERERRLWRRDDLHHRAAARQRFPLCEGTAAGIAAALTSLSDQRVRTPPPLPARLPPPGAQPAVRIAAGLGEAFGWACACAAVRPISVGLADALRRQFFKGLSPLAMGRLARLDGTSISDDGIVFALPVYRILKRAFDSETPAGLCARVRAFVAEAIKAHVDRLGPDRSLARLQYEMYLGRFLLDFAPDEGITRLEDLADTAVRGELARILGEIDYPGLGSGGPIALAAAPRDPTRLLALGRRLELPTAWPYRLRRRVRDVGSEAPIATVAFDPATGGIAFLDVAGRLGLCDENGEGLRTFELEPLIAAGGRVLRRPHFGDGFGNARLTLGPDHLVAVAVDGRLTIMRNRTNRRQAEELEMIEDGSAAARARQESHPPKWPSDLHLVASYGVAQSSPSPLTALTFATVPDKPGSPGTSGTVSRVVIGHAGRTLSIWPDGVSQSRVVFPVNVSESGSETSPIRFERIAAIGLGYSTNRVAVMTDEGMFELTLFGLARLDALSDRLAAVAEQVTVDHFAFVEDENGRGGSLVIAGDGRIAAYTDRLHGPWRLPAGRVEDLRLLDGGRTAAVLVGGHLAVVDVETGVERLAAGLLHDRVHAAIALERQTVLVLSDNRRALKIFPTTTMPEAEPAPEVARRVARLPSPRREAEATVAP